VEAAALEPIRYISQELFFSIFLPFVAHSLTRSLHDGRKQLEANEKGF